METQNQKNIIYTERITYIQILDNVKRTYSYEDTRQFSQAFRNILQKS
jgi:hypothetical protein